MTNLSRHLAKRRSAKRSKDILGATVILAVAAGFAGLFTVAARIDASNGITPAESMCNNGFTAFCDARTAVVPLERSEPFAAKLARYAEAPAIDARLIGYCGGRIMAATEESAFPAGCAWIETPADAAAKLEALGAPDHAESGK